jgi:hypothetical protein
MDEHTYRALLEQPTGFTPALAVPPEEVTSFEGRTIQDANQRTVIPFGGLILPFHEVVLSTPYAVHDFLKSHFTRKLRDLTSSNPVYIRACPISGWIILEQLSRKGLIVDHAVRLQVARVVANFPARLQHSVQPHILNKLWSFYTLLPSNRAIVAQHLRELNRSESDDASLREPPVHPVEARQWPNGF